MGRKLFPNVFRSLADFRLFFCSRLRQVTGRSQHS